MLETRLEKWLQTLWEENPEIKELLVESRETEQARAKLQAWLYAMEVRLREASVESTDLLDVALGLDAVERAKSILGRRNERLAKTSTLETLMRLAHDDTQGVGAGFVAELVHLLRAARAKAQYSEGWLGRTLPDSTVFEGGGREAARERSDYLDKLTHLSDIKMARFKTALDPQRHEQRQANIRRILEYFGGTAADWDDWKWQMRHVLRGPKGVEHLRNLVPLTDEELEACRFAVDNGVAFGITPYYLSLFDFESANREWDYAARAQVIPPLHYVKEMTAHREDRDYVFDFMGEHDTSPEELVTRRYPMTAIIKPYNTCPQICVYCQRNWEITDALQEDAESPRGRLDRALDWLGEHDSIRAVLITGGDPAVLSDDKLDYIFGRLAAYEHIVQIRLATRTLVTMPMRFTQALVATLDKYLEPGKRNVVVVTHFEHVSEITPEVLAAVTQLRKAGIYVYNQLVYTAHVSRRFEAVALRMELKKAGIDPYYTFYPKGKEEHRGYTLPVARVVQERKEEARLLSGQFRTDEPVFNVPRLGKSHMRASQDRKLLGFSPEGRRIYLWYPWEKGVTHASTYVHRDVGLMEYLEFLEKAGEDAREYESLWYYY